MHKCCTLIFPLLGGMTLLMLLAFNFLNKFQCTREDGRDVQYGEMGSARAPLLPHKDDDLSSWGSSYDSVSDEDNIEDLLALGPLEGVSLGDGENSNNTRRLCAICFDAPRDCFFLPCGHCVELGRYSSSFLFFFFFDEPRSSIEFFSWKYNVFMLQ
jgi:hypothetical protein